MNRSLYNRASTFPLVLALPWSRTRQAFQEHLDYLRLIFIYLHGRDAGTASLKWTKGGSGISKGGLVGKQDVVADDLVLTYSQYGPK